MIKKRKYYVYLIKNKAHKENNGYVGKSHNPELRFKTHKKTAFFWDEKESRYWCQTPLCRAMRKYGVENFYIDKILSIHRIETASLKNEVSKTKQQRQW